MTAIENIINQIENETRRFGNTKTRVAAVLRLIKAKLVELFSGKLDKGRYTGTADDLNNAIGNKVDKVPGKILSSNDFTNELRTKLEGLQNVDISQLLPKGGYTGTAQNLKELIDNIMRILQSPDTELDELREIVAFIKQNKRTLDTLGIRNIAGLQDALNGKAPNDHHHDDRYSRLGHTHTEYALRTHTHSEYAPKNHRHNWNEIDGKPEMVTEEKIQEAVGDVFKYRGSIPIANINNIAHEQGSYNVPSPGGAGSGAYLKFKTMGSASSLEFFKSDWIDATRIGVRNTVDGSSFNGDNGAFRDLAWYGDVYRAGGVIGTSWVAEKEWQNGVIFVQTSLNVDLSGLQHLGNMSFRKVFAGSNVTFTCEGKQIIYTGDTAFNGGDGSTAVVSIYGNKCYIDIRNI